MAATCSNGLSAQILSAAAKGGSGKGIRTWHAGNNIPDGGTFAVNLSSSQTEVWGRFYMRFPAGMTYSTLEDYKILWVTTNGSQNSTAILSLQDSGYCTNAFRFWNQNTSTEVVCGTTDLGWSNMNGGAAADGDWHLFEFHLKRHTTSSPYNGIEEIKIDGTTVLSATNIDFGDNQLSSYRFDVNTKYLSSSTCQAIDYDSLAISNTGWIGADGGGETITCYQDADNDLYGHGVSESVSSCSSGYYVANHFTELTGDCNDSNSGINPSAVDVCGNEIDEDCSGTDATCGGGSTITPGTLIFSESFESAIDNNRGWVDGTIGSSAISSEGYSGNTAKLTWVSGQQLPTGITTVRRDMGTGRNQIYAEFYVKFATGWRGSGQNYHPHLMWIRGSDDFTAGEWDGPAYAYQNIYMEFHAATTSPYYVRPVWFIQDGKRVNTSYGTPPQSIADSTETRSVGSCNGAKTGAYAGDYNDCFNISGSQWWSQLGWRGSATILPNTWYKMAYAIKLNTVTGGVGNADGETSVWIDDVEVMSAQNVILRPGNDGDDTLRQFAISPYIGDTSPITQTMYIDELKVYDGYTENPGTPTRNMKTGTGSMRVGTGNIRIIP